ncbi:endoplasmic reticulum-based factor for assembly of V-ATPase-domain-containing protein [Peziza echinospora]|nr:endoplasmic reticulum-based factor for assembly of V-ATPase-domain-containing protein [Peziza echinospora]
MLILRATPTILDALKVYEEHGLTDPDPDAAIKIPRLPTTEATARELTIAHTALVRLSQALYSHFKSKHQLDEMNKYRINKLLFGATIYNPPPHPKPEPTEEYKALMKKLRHDQEQAEYQSYLNPSDPSSLATNKSSPEEDEYTLKDLRSDISILVNVVLSILATAAAVWYAAQSWPVPQRLGLALSSCALVGVAEVVVLTGYYRKIDEAKVKERGKKEVKEVVRTWEVSRAMSDEKEVEKEKKKGAKRSKKAD